MGCVSSKDELLATRSPVADARNNGGANGEVPAESSITPAAATAEPAEFREFTWEELSEATGNFRNDMLVSARPGGWLVPNAVYRGQLASGGEIAVKRFSRHHWQSRDAFINEAAKVGRLRLDGLVPLLGCCCNGQDRLLVAEFAPGGTLHNRLFLWEEKPMPWSQRLLVAKRVALALSQIEAVDGLQIYDDLNTHRVLYDKNGVPHLSSFPLLRPPNDDDSSSSSSSLPNLPPEIRLLGQKGATRASVRYNYGSVLLALLSGKSIWPSQFLEQVRAIGMMPSSLIIDCMLLGRPGAEQAIELVGVAVDCLHEDPASRPAFAIIFQFITDFLEPGTAAAVSKAPHEAATRAPVDVRLLSPFGQAAIQGNYRALHEFLVKESYGTPPQEVSFKAWNEEMQELLNARRKGDNAFRARSWERAIEYYNKHVALDLPQPLMFARRCVAYLHVRDWPAALKDAHKAAALRPHWPEACFLQAAVLQRLGMAARADAALAEGAWLERERAAPPSSSSSRPSPPPGLSPAIQSPASRTPDSASTHSWEGSPVPTQHGPVGNGVRAVAAPVELVL